MVSVNDAPMRARESSARWNSAVKQYGDDVIALSVADMDLTAPAEVLKAVATRAQQGSYGYTYLPPSYFTHVQDWMAKRHNWTIPASGVLYTHRIVEAVSVILEEFTARGDDVLIHTPSYGPVTNLIEPLGRRLVTSKLLLTDGRYEIDFDETERLLASEAKVLVLFSPHNPSGRVWTRAELTRLAEIANRHDVLIISDDVHADLVHSGHKHVPIATLDAQTAQRTITLTSPGKPFNLAGLEISNIITDNSAMLEQLRRALHLRGIDAPSYFAVAALEAAYGRGESWLDALMVHVARNLTAVRDFARVLPGVRLIEPEGTYLAWLDCREWTSDEAVLTDWMRAARVALTPGTAFGADYQGFVRVNLAVPTEQLETALTRLDDAYPG